MSAYCVNNYNLSTSQQKTILKLAYKQNRQISIRCLNRLGCRVELPNLFFAHIDINTVSEPLIGHSVELDENTLIDNLDISTNTPSTTDSLEKRKQK